MSLAGDLAEDVLPQAREAVVPVHDVHPVARGPRRETPDAVGDEFVEPMRRQPRDKGDVMQFVRCSEEECPSLGTGPLKALAAGQWCEVDYDGSAWVLTAFGSL